MARQHAMMSSFLLIKTISNFNETKFLTRTILNALWANLESSMRYFVEV